MVQKHLIKGDFMKVWIDKQGGTHYHKEDCEMLKPFPPTDNKLLARMQFHYEGIERQLRKDKFGWWQDIIVDGKRYGMCPICFGHGGRK